MPIKVLAPEVVSKIAAGEVVERPASIVKELIDNSIDAGATHVYVEARGGGLSLIRVVDNGAGMGPDDASLAFQRYATSKISAVKDLDSIVSLGFRGEALPSIAAVAEVEMLTRSADDLAGVYIGLKGGMVVGTEKRACPQGTSVTVRHLFRDVPARLKFMKSSSTENGHIATMVTHYALAYPEVRFTLAVDGRQTLRTPGSGEMRDTVSEIYGLDMAQRMLDVSFKDPAHSVTGLVSPPSVTRANRNYLSFFVNRRWVHSSLLIRAVEDAYHGQLMVGKHPVAMLNVTLPPSEVDVNVHPAKTEVKFRNSQALYAAVGKPVRAALEDTPVREVSSAKAPAPPQPELWQEDDRPDQAPAVRPAEAAPQPPGLENQVPDGEVWHQSHQLLKMSRHTPLAKKTSCPILV